VKLIKLSDVRKKRKREEKEQHTKMYQDYLERIYGHTLSAVEETDFRRLSTGGQISEVLYRLRIAIETTLVPWATDEEVEAHNKKKSQ